MNNRLPLFERFLMFIGAFAILYGIYPFLMWAIQFIPIGN